LLCHERVRVVDCRVIPAHVVGENSDNVRRTGMRDSKQQTKGRALAC
jgi:hypothetical protein